VQENPTVAGLLLPVLKSGLCDEEKGLVSIFIVDVSDSLTFKAQ
jgi:hypothetical protein